MSKSKNHSLNSLKRLGRTPINRIGWHILNFFIVAGPSFIILYTTSAISVKNFNIGNFNLTVCTIGSILIVIFTYLRELWVTRKERNRLKIDSTIYGILDGLIDRMGFYKGYTITEKRHIIPQFLHGIEGCLKARLREDGIEIGSLMSNYMIRKSNGLKITHFGTTTIKRKNSILTIQKDGNQAGAPIAVRRNEIVYVPDTSLPEYKKCFNHCSYKSVLSIPISKPNSDYVIGVVNLDSSVKNQFGTEEYVSSTITRLLSPFQALLELAVGKY